MKKVQIATDLSMNKGLKTSLPSGFALWYPTSSNKHHKLERYCLSWQSTLPWWNTHMGVAIQPLEIPQSLGIQTCLARFQDANVPRSSKGFDCPMILRQWNVSSDNCITDELRCHRNDLPQICGSASDQKKTEKHSPEWRGHITLGAELLKRSNSAGSGTHHVFPCLAWENWPIWSKKFENYHEIEWEINMSPIHVWPSTETQFSDKHDHHWLNPIYWWLITSNSILILVDILSNLFTSRCQASLNTRPAFPLPRRKIQQCCRSPAQTIRLVPNGCRLHPNNTWQANLQVATLNKNGPVLGH